MTSERTINQVRAILNKLDRSIDEARERRTHPEPAKPVSPPVAPVAPVASAPATAPQASTPGADASRGSPFGRAQPLNRPQNAPTWRSV
jgi:hypothetical protein